METLTPFESGKSQTVGSFVVDLKSATIVGELGEEDCDNCKGYAEVSINLLAVSIDAETVPDAQIKLSPGQTASVGPYILRYDYPLGTLSRRRSSITVARSWRRAALDWVRYPMFWHIPVR